jgi:hypothetical protein
MKKFIKTTIHQITTRAKLRLEQELMVLRYVLFCTPSMKTIMVLALRMTILFASFIVFASLIISYNFTQSIGITAVALSICVWITACFVWEFGYTLQHFRRYASWLAMLLLLPLPLYFSIYSNTLHLVSSKVSVLPVEGHKPSSKPTYYHLEKMTINTITGSLSKRSSELGLDADIAPEITDLPMAFPNPMKFASQTEIGFETSKDLVLDIKIYNMFGHLVREIKDIDSKYNHYNRVPFDGKDASGDSLSPGGYFYLIVDASNAVLGKGKLAINP